MLDGSNYKLNCMRPFQRFNLLFVLSSAQIGLALSRCSFFFFCFCLVGF